MRARVAGLVAVAAGLGTLLGCTSLEGMEAEQPCLEAGWAISSRTFDCSGDGERANARYERFLDEMACIPHELGDEGPTKLAREKDLFHCAYVIRTLTCADVADFGDEIDAWMSVSPACNLVATYADGTPLPPFDGFESNDPDALPDPECPTEQGGPVTFEIANTSPSAELDLYWLQNGTCQEVYYGRLDFAVPREQQTYEGHVWVVRQTRDLSLVDWFVAEDGLTVNVP